MPEQQNIEYKSAWHDDYLKWVCGFVNTQGGVILSELVELYGIFKILGKGQEASMK